MSVPSPSDRPRIDEKRKLTGSDPGGTYRQRIESAITRYVESDRPELLQFREGMYGRDSSYCNASYLRWLYEECPHRREEPLLWLYRRNGRVEGEQGAIPMPVRIDGAERFAVWIVDLSVSPQFQNRGVGTLLSARPLREASLAMAMEVTDRAFAAMRRSGWRDLGVVPLWVRPLDVSAMIARRFVSPLARAVVGTTAAFGMKVLDQFSPAASRSTRLHMEPIGRFDDRVDTLWRTAAPHYPTICVRDSRTLNWRFIDFPQRDRYQAFYFFRRREVRGYAVLRIGDRNGLRVGYIADFLSEPSVTPALLGRCLLHLRTEGAAAAYCLHQNPVSARPFHRTGFLRRPSGWRFMVRAHGRPDATMATFQQAESWYLTAGDSNVDRPREGTVYAPEPELPVEMPPLGA